MQLSPELVVHIRRSTWADRVARRARQLSGAVAVGRGRSGARRDLRWIRVSVGDAVGDVRRARDRPRGRRGPGTAALCQGHRRRGSRDRPRAGRRRRHLHRRSPRHRGRCCAPPPTSSQWVSSSTPTGPRPLDPVGTPARRLGRRRRLRRGVSLRPPPEIGAMQGLDPDRVVYGGTASKSLAPASASPGSCCRPRSSSRCSIPSAWGATPSRRSNKRLLPSSSHPGALIATSVHSDCNTGGGGTRSCGCWPVGRTYLTSPACPPDCTSLRSCATADEREVLDTALQHGIAMFGLGNHRITMMPHRHGLVIGYSRSQASRLSDSARRTQRSPRRLLKLNRRPRRLSSSAAGCMCPVAGIPLPGVSCVSPCCQGPLGA